MKKGHDSRPLVRVSALVLFRNLTLLVGRASGLQKPGQFIRKGPFPEQVEEEEGRGGTS